MANLEAALAAAHRIRRSRRRAPWLVLLVLAGLLLQTVAAFAASFTTVNAPFVKANDFITGMPTCTNFGEGVQGPIGLLQDDSHFFVGDSCNGTMYRYPATGGSQADTVVANGLDGGMATGGGVYYGIALGLTAPRVQQFDPNTLTPGPIVMTASNFLYDLLYNPQTGDLWASGRDGLYRITTPSANPTATVVITPPSGHEFDGIALSPDYSTIWVADHGGGHVYSYDDTTYAQTHDLSPGCSGPDGMAIAPPNTLVAGLDVSNDVFVNCNDGSIRMLDPSNSANDKTVASGGTRGDFAAVGTDGYMYATQGDRVEQLVPGFFGPKFGARATGLMFQSPQLVTNKADTGFYSNPSGGQVETYAAFGNVPPNLAAWVMHSTAQTSATPPGGEARAESTIDEIDISTGTTPNHTIKAWSLDAVADTICSKSVAGSSSIGGISIDGSPTEPVKAQNVVLDLGTVVVTLNEIDVSTASAQRTEVTSIHLQAPSYDVRISVALATAAAC